MRKNRESVLFYFALLLLAGVLFYNIFSTPVLYRAKVSPEKPALDYAVSAAESSTNITELVPSSAASEAEPGKVNINTAGQEELESLPGTGEARARAIIEERRKNGAFASVHDLTRVPGIGEKIYEKLKNNITV